MTPARPTGLPGPRIPCEVEVAVSRPAELGEGPRWDAATATLLWVDILGKAVHRLDPRDGRDVVTPVPDLVGFALPRAAGGVIVGLPDGVFALGDNGRTELLTALETDAPGNRLNDAACDPRGRLWAGTMALDERSPTGALYRVGADLAVTREFAGTTISNGLGWSPAGDAFYFIDTPTGRVDAFDFDPAAGSIARRRPLAVVDVPGAGPDGMTVDAEGSLWVALHGGWGLLRFSPDGRLLGHVDLPVAKVTSCCFGGPGLRDLYVTTRRQSLSDAELSEQPLAGALLRLDPGVAGLPTHAFGG